MDVICCAFCLTGQEALKAEQFNAVEGIRALSPVRVRRDKENGRWVDKTITMMPGYFFLYGDDQERIRREASKQGVRLLYYGEDANDFNLVGTDRAFAQWILQHDGVIGVSKVVNEGDHIRVVEGALKDMEAVIERIDKRRRLALVVLNISKFRVWLSFDWLE